MNREASALPELVVEIEGDLAIATAGLWKGRLVDAARWAGGARLDLSRVTHIDGAGLQLLLLAAREARRQASCLTLHAPSRAVGTALALARLGEDLHPRVDTACCGACGGDGAAP